MNQSPELAHARLAPRSGVPIIEDRVVELSKQGIQWLDDALKTLRALLTNEPWLSTNPKEAVRHILAELPGAIESVTSTNVLLKRALESRTKEIKSAKAPYVYLDGYFRPWLNGEIHFLSHTVQYGTGAFEGIRAYSTPKGIGIFRLGDHLKRLQQSAQAIGMELPLTEEALVNITIDLLNLNNLGEVYIRPTALYDVKGGVSPKGTRCYLGMACWPWGKYVQGTKVFVSDHAKPGGKLKVNGYYVELARAKLEIEGTDFAEILVRDPQDFNVIAEGGGENLFIVRNGTIYTPPEGPILEGITRETLMYLAACRGIEVIKKTITLPELLEADEIFLSGTAAEVSPITDVSSGGKLHTIGTGQVGPITTLISDDYADVVHGRTHTDKNWITYVEAEAAVKRSAPLAEQAAQV